MTALTWTDKLALNQPLMDATHQEFVTLLAQCDAAVQDEPALLARWAALVEHTDAHFAQEERWMAALGFTPDNCHQRQHQIVLDIMRECGRRAALAEQPDFEPLRAAIDELAQWFPMHAQMMDAALAETMAEQRFDPASGQHAAPRPGDAAPISGCGGASCTPAAEAPGQASAATPA